MVVNMCKNNPCMQKVQVYICLFATFNNLTQQTDIGTLCIYYYKVIVSRYNTASVCLHLTALLRMIVMSLYFYTRLCMKNK